MPQRVRAQVPVPICIQPLPRASGAAAVSVAAEDYWRQLFPSTAESELGLATVDCTGRMPLAALGEAQLLVVDSRAASVFPASDRFKLVWLRSHREAGSVDAGLMALVRIRAAALEVYGTGLLRGLSDTKLALERMGHELIVTALLSNCATAAGAACGEDSQIFRLESGQLRLAATVPLTRFARGRVPERRGVHEFRFAASVEFDRGGLSVSEHLSVFDPDHGRIQSSELHRKLSPSSEGMQASEPSLWVELSRRLEPATARP